MIINNVFQLDDSSKLSADSCVFSNCKEYGVRKESKKLNDSECYIGDVNILQNVADICIQNCKFENNVKGNIYLKSCANIILPTREESMII